MSKEYDYYILEHVRNVKKALEWMKENLPESLIDKTAMTVAETLLVGNHDQSKWSPEEYDAYDSYFYRNADDRTESVKKEFDKAWLHHIHNNPHHWQHWVLFEDDPEGLIPYKALDMPLHYIYEMIADWWSFSWKNENLTEIFKWYLEHRDKQIMSLKTRIVVEAILKAIADVLKVQMAIEGLKDDDIDILSIWINDGHLQHSGVQGMKWGIKNGPPYPLNTAKVAEKIFRKAKEKSKKITDDVEDAAKHSGGNMHGLENQLKSAGSIERKLNKKMNENGMDITEAANAIKDAVRYTVIAPTDSFVNMYHDFTDNMSEKGYEETSCDNYFDKFNKGEVKHKAVQSNFMDKDGYEFEVQFHTPESQDAKDKKLPLYNERRMTDISNKRAKELEQQMEELALNVPDPDRIGDIPSFTTSYSKHTKAQLSNEVQKLQKELNSLKSDKDADPEYVELIEMELEQTKRDLSLKHSDIEDSDEGLYGIPEIKKYPMPDKDHVKSAIKFFNYVDPKYETELAEAILEKAEEYGLVFGKDISVGDENRFKKYLSDNSIKKENNHDQTRENG